MMNSATVLPLPPQSNLESRLVLKTLTQAHRYLAELKGMAATIPNELILINTLTVQEAKDSSEIENVITTYDHLYKTSLFTVSAKHPPAKEVERYAAALRTAYVEIKDDQLLTVNRIIKIQEALIQNDAGFRKVPGTSLKNEKTGETVYTPPQSEAEIVRLMKNLEQYINDDSLSNVDALVKMAVIHHQFESIHPFYDGNGRTGRIVNILYLLAKELLDLPILYLSRYIVHSKHEYYQLLQFTRDTGDWEPWIVYMLKGVEHTSRQAIWLIRQIRDVMLETKHKMRTQLPKIYSQELLNNLFWHPYTKIEFVENQLDVSRLTARRYLELLAQNGIVEKHRYGRYNFYINRPLMDIFTGMPAVSEKSH